MELQNNQYHIHAIDGDYILWGEGEVFRYDRMLRPVWRASARDIIVTQDFSKSFWIDGKQIHYRDWEGWHYIIDLDGNSIANFQEVNH